MLALRWRDTLAAHPRRARSWPTSTIRSSCGPRARPTTSRGSRAAPSGTATRPRARRAARSSRATRDIVVVPGVRARTARSRRSTPRGSALRVAGVDYPYALALPGRANRGNLAMAVGAARRARRADRRARSPRSRRVREVSGRYARHRVDGHEVILLLAKNPAGWVETLDVIDELLPDGSGTVVVAINARGPDGRDPSWLWDVPFEQLAGRAVIATGERATDLAVRLDHAGVDVPQGHARRRCSPRASAARRPGRDRGDLHELPGALAGARPPWLTPWSTSRSCIPELLGTYGDGGNALVLARRLARRGIAARVIEVGITDPVPRQRRRSTCSAAARTRRSSPRSTRCAPRARSTAAVDAGAVVLAVCAGFQLIGTSLAGRRRHAGRRARPGRRGHDARAEAAGRRGRGARRRARHRLARRLREPPRRHRRSGAGAMPLGPRQPERGCATDGVVQRPRRRHLPARPGARAQSRASRISCSSGSSARSRRSPIRRPSCCTRSATPRSSAQRGVVTRGHGDGQQRSSAGDHGHDREARRQRSVEVARRSGRSTSTPTAIAAASAEPDPRTVGEPVRGAGRRRR